MEEAHGFGAIARPVIGGRQPRGEMPVIAEEHEIRREIHRIQIAGLVGEHRFGQARAIQREDVARPAARRRRAAARCAGHRTRRSARFSHWREASSMSGRAAWPPRILPSASVSCTYTPSTSKSGQSARSGPAMPSGSKIATCPGLRRPEPARRSAASGCARALYATLPPRRLSNVSISSIIPIPSGGAVRRPPLRCRPPAPYPTTSGVRQNRAPARRPPAHP